MPLAPAAIPPLVRRRSSSAGWEMLSRAPHPALREAVVGEYQGWIDAASAPLCRREVPGALVPLIFNFGAPFLLGGARLREPLLRGSFVAGLWSGYALSQATGPTVAIQVNLTPLGAYRLLGESMSALADRAVPIDELFGASARHLLERLEQSVDWERRFALVDEFLGARWERGRAPAPAISWAWRALRSTRGRLPIGRLSRELGWSHRRLIVHWRDHFGLAPKELARIVRFEAVLGCLEECGEARKVRWAAIADDCGYADQSHLVRECSALAGVSPTELLASRLADGGGLSAGLLLGEP